MPKLLGQDSVTVTVYTSYDGFYDYVRGPALSDAGKIGLILVLITTYIGYHFWRRSKHRVIP